MKKTVKHINYWCLKPSEAFPEKRDHRKCDSAPQGGKIRFEFRFVCVCSCHRKKKAKRK
jgi:hypothetical protein